MVTPIIMPKFGQMTEESSIVEWLKKEGDLVAKGDILFTVETDKSVMDVQSFEAGTLLKIVVPPRVNVPVQSTVGFLGQPGEAVPAVPSPPPRPAPIAASVPPAPPSPSPLPAAPMAAASIPVAAPAFLAPAPSAPALFRISPRAAALARSCVIDPSPIKGSGPLGRVVERDVQRYLESRGYHHLRVTPAARELAARENVDLLAVRPGDGGRVSLADVQLALAEKPKPMSRLRQIIAQRLTQSFRDTPHFYVTVSVDMTDLLACRAELKAAGAPYTVTDFIAEAVVLTLQEFPDVNSSTDGRTTRWNSQVNLGIAVSLEQGLVVPVIRAAGQLSLLELSRSTKALAEKARVGKATPDELSGGTFTISNLGMMDVESFGAIINPGESAILAVASTQPRPVVRDGKIVVRQMMKLTLSCDHRIVDGALGARFINAIKQKLEDIELWKRLTA
ncbi:MAG: dihydrolipoamide acetyltransferase family protein [Verrucomicrobiota bacterium]|jgi:pyruvate dehydrogenase E2 component (dihydrolipoamide acetyltransferase)